MANQFRYFNDPIPQLYVPQNDSTQQKQQGRFGDNADSATAGILSAAGGMFDFIGAESIAKKFYGWSDDQQSTMSDRAKTALAKPFFEENEKGQVSIGEGLTDLDTWLLTISNVAGQFVPTAVPGAGAAGLATKSLKLGTTGSKVATAASMGATGGAAATGQSMEQARDEVRNMPDAVLAESPLFREVFRGVYQQQPDWTDEQKWDAAKDAIATKVAGEVRSDPKVLLANFGASAIGDPIIGKALMGARLAKSGALRSAAKGFAVEGTTEAAQAGVTQYGINEALQPIDNRDAMKGVTTAALNEGVAGGGFGGLAGGFGGLLNRNNQQQQPTTEPEQTQPDPVADALRDTNPELATAFDSLNETLSSSSAAIDELVNYDLPTAARNAGFNTSVGAGQFGDMLTSPVQQSIEQMRSQTIADLVNAAAQFRAPTEQDRFSPVPFQYEGEVLRSENPVSAGALPGATLPGEQARFIPDNRLDGEYQQPIRTQPMPQGIPDKNIIFAGDNRPAQAEQEQADNLQRQAQQFADNARSDYQPRIPQKDIIFAGNQSGVTVKQSGQPFMSPKEALASKGARDAKRSGIEIEAVPFADGYGWRVVQSDTTSNGGISVPEPTQAAPVQTEIDGNSSEVLPLESNAEPAADLAGDAIDPEWTAFADETGTKKIPRSEMPQIKAEHRGAMVQFMKGRGITHEQDTVPATELKPTQAEFSPGKVQKAMDYDGGNRSILVSSDGYVLDGHHQWLAAREKGETVEVIRLDAPIDHLVPLAREFPSSTVADGADARSQNPEPVTQISQGSSYRVINDDLGKLAKNGTFKVLSINEALGTALVETSAGRKEESLTRLNRALAKGGRLEVVPEPTNNQTPADAGVSVSEDAESEVKPAESKATQSNASKSDINESLDMHVKTMKAVRDGVSTLEQYQSAFLAIADNKESVTAELNKMTIPQLLKSGGGMFEYRHRGDKKAEIVDALYSEMLREYSLDRSYGPSTFLGTSKGIDDHRTAKFKALRELVENTSNEDLESFAGEVKKARDEIATERAAKKAALANPETLQDFNALMRAKMQDGLSRDEAFLSLTPEQRATYDELAAEVTKESRDKAKREAKTVIKAAGQATAGTIIETKHTKYGYDLFVAQLDDRLSRDDYQTMLAAAKKMGGWYSKFRGNGAVPGFQFKDRSAAEAFVALAQGDTTQAEQQVNVARDAFEDDKSQSAAERLNTMANKLDERAEEELSRPRLANTDRRARFAAAGDASARRDQALAATMRNIAKAISEGTAKFLDAVRQKTQIEYLQQLLNVARYDEVSTKYKDYREQEAQRGSPATVETVDFVKFPSYTAYRSDLANLGRQLLEIDGLKTYGKKIMDVADDVTDAYLEFAKDNLYKVATFVKKNSDGTKADFATYGNKGAAEAAIRRSGYRGKAIVLPVKRGENVVIMSPSEAINRGIWKGDGDKRITLKASFGNELVAAIGRKMRGRDGVRLPWQFESAYENLNKLQRMGIQTPAELRSALREFVSLQKNAKAPDKVKQMEREMVGRSNDGLDFFPTPEGITQQMLDAAEIKDGMRVLEPSAGMGHIAEAVRAAGVDPDVVEFSPNRRELLELKGFNVVGNDFMAVNDGGYDRIVMNPPFSQRRDAEHVQHAYELLNPGGRIVAIMGEGVFFGQDKKAEQFREWLDSVGGYTEKLPENSFMDKSLPVTTGVNTRMVVIDKPESDIQFSSANYSVLRNQKAKGVPPAQVEMMAKLFMKRINGAAGIKVVVLRDQKEAELAFNQSLSGSIVRGAYNDKTKTAYLIADNFDSIEHARRTLAHEVIAHGGLQSVIGVKAYSDFLDRINATRTRASFRPAWNGIMKDYGDLTPEKQAEEFFARWVEDQPETGSLKYWWKALLRWLNVQLAKVGVTRAENADVAAMRDMLDSIVQGFKSGRAPRRQQGKAVAFDRSETDLDFSRTAEPDTRTAKEKLGLGEQADETLKEKATTRYHETADTLKSSKFWQRLNEGIFDGMAGIKQAEESVGVTDPNKQGYVSARLASGLADVLHGVFHYGAPEWKNGVVARKADTKGLLEVFSNLGDDLNNWLAWMGANRAEKLMAEGRENNLTADDIAELKALAAGKEEQFEAARQEYNKINSAIIDLAQQAGLISEAQRSGFDEEWYVPFFRDMDVDPEMQGIAAMVHGPKSKQGIANQNAQLKELKGGAQSTKDLLENIIQRHSTLIDAALKNNAMLEIVGNLSGTDYMQPVTSPEIAALSQTELNLLSKVKVMRDGKPEAYAVSDPALLRGLLQINDAGSKSLFNRLGRSAKRFLTAGITLSPDFIVKNFVRDAAHAWMVNKDDFKFGADSIKGLRKAFKEDETYRDLIFSGAAFQGGYVHGADPEAAAQQVRRALSAKGLTKNQVESYMDSLVTKGSQLLERYRNASDKVENANRLSTYEAALASGKSRREAAFISKDLMDYSLRGNFTTIGTMIDMLPFFNARLQGLSKLVRASRAGDNDRVLKVLSANLAMKGIKVAAFSLALAALNNDDERYQELADWDKDANWHFWLGDDHVRIPKPFELGIIFGTFPERMLHYGTGTQPASDLGKAVGHAVFNTLALNPIPQLALPLAEVAFNKSFFRGTDIENMSDENKLKEDRYNAYTSDTAKLAGQITKYFGVSPKQVEHLVLGYTGTIGGYVLSISDVIARQMLGIEKAETPISRYPVIKAFYHGDAPKTNTKFQQEFYDALKAANQAYGSYKRAAEEGNTERQQALLEANSDKLRSRIQLNRLQRQISELNKQAEIVNRSQSLGGAQKREQLDDIARRKNALYQAAYVRFNLGEW